MEIYITFRPKYLSCDLTNIPPLYSTRKQVTVLQTKLRASADRYIRVSQAYRQEEKFAHLNCIP
jgi:hypothetical protein